MRNTLILTAAILLISASVQAQAPVTPPTEVTLPAATPSGTSIRLKDMWLEILITTGLCGFVIFSVCRSSQRN